MKTLPPVTSRIQTVTLSIGRGRFQKGLCSLVTMLRTRLALLLLFFACGALAQPCAGTPPFQWALTGNLNIPRAYHTATNTTTATMLSNGKILVAGGAGPRPGGFHTPDSQARKCTTRTPGIGRSLAPSMMVGYSTPRRCSSMAGY